MSVYLEIGNAQAQVATNSGWGEVVAWARSLPPDRVPALAHLVDHGWTKRRDQLIADLKVAAEADPPPDVASVLRTVYAAVAAAPSGDAVLVTNGMV